MKYGVYIHALLLLFKEFLKSLSKKGWIYFHSPTDRLRNSPTGHDNAIGNEPLERLEGWTGKRIGALVLFLHGRPPHFFPPKKILRGLVSEDPRIPGGSARFKHFPPPKMAICHKRPGSDNITPLESRSNRCTPTGYYTGILVNEHTDGDNINLASNINGLEFAFAHHASRFGRVGAQRCTHAIAVTGRHGFSIEQLDMEIAGKGQTNSNNQWQATEYNIDDPKNLGTADINYWVVEGNVGATEKFTRNGGATIRTRRIGSAPRLKADDANSSPVHGLSRICQEKGEAKEQ